MKYMRVASNKFQMNADCISPIQFLSAVFGIVTFPTIYLTHAVVYAYANHNLFSR